MKHLRYYEVEAVEAMQARIAALERELEQAKEDRARAAMDARNPLLARIAELEAEAKQAREDEAWARSQFDCNGSVCVVFHPVSVTAKKFCGTGWAVVQHAETAAAALRALRANVKGGAR